MPSLARLSKRFRTAGTNWRLDLRPLGEYLRTHLKDHTKYDQGPEIHGKPRRVLLSVGDVQLAGCLKVSVAGPLESSSDNAQGVQDTADEASVSTATPDWRTVLICLVD